MRQHFVDRHPNWRAIISEDRYKAFVASITISFEEHEGLRVPEKDCVSWPDHELPILQRIREPVPNEIEPPRTRARR